MNLNYDGADHFFGDLIQYSRGEMQALIDDIGRDAATVNVEQLPPPKDKEYVNAVMYWFVAGNHVLVIQSRALGVKQLELYFSWLLKEKTGVIETDSHVILKAKFDAQEIGGDLEDIREIIVGESVNVAAAAAVSVGASEPLGRHTLARRSWRESAVEMLRIIFNSEADVRELLDSVPQEADLEVSVHFGYKSRKRGISPVPMQRALRNLPEGEVTAIGRDGRLTGKDIRLSHSINVRTVGSLLKHEDVLAGFRETYARFREHDRIRD
jgi:hypothetical protein